MDTDGLRGFIDSWLAYGAISRAAHNAHLQTNDSHGLAVALSTEYTKTSPGDSRPHLPDAGASTAIGGQLVRKMRRGSNRCRCAAYPGLVLGLCP